MGTGHFVDCSRLECLKVSRSACLTMVAAACEVFPNECIGNIFSSVVPNSEGVVAVAVTYQEADRCKISVTPKSRSINRIQQVDGVVGKWCALGNFHSHTCDSNKDLEFYSKPSLYDLEKLTPGNLEIILRVSKRSYRKINSWRNTQRGNISISWGLYQIMIRGFVRQADIDKNKRLRYKTIRLELEA